MILSSDEIKQRVAGKAIERVQPGMVIGLGSGSTMHWFIQALAAQVKEGLPITAVPTSLAVQQLAAENGIPLTTLNEIDSIDLAIDGADEIDGNWELIKGGGGALLQEKMVASVARELVIIADHTKMVERLGKFPLPVEVIPYGWKQIQKGIQNFYEIAVTLREKNHQPFVTEHGHYILDCHFQHIDNAPELDRELKLVTGVVETGLFIGMASGLCIGYPDGSIKQF